MKKTYQLTISTEAEYLTDELIELQDLQIDFNPTDPTCWDDNELSPIGFDVMLNILIGSLSAVIQDAKSFGVNEGLIFKAVLDELHSNFTDANRSPVESETLIIEK